MILSFQIKNFKCFDDLNLSLGKLTLLTGFNGGGKSSAIQPLLLLSQNTRLSQDVSNYALNGALVQLGTVGDVLPSDASVSPVQFILQGSRSELSWTFSARAGDRFLRMSDRKASSAGLSPSNQREFAKELTFPDPASAGNIIFAHWHGKISHRYFRLHFEWPIPSGADVLKITYLGPKITKA
jgi:predicted ATPase